MMSGDRGAEIERFYWLILNLLGKGIGYLFLIGGSLFVAAFASELLRTDLITWNGKKLTQWGDQWPVLAGGAAFALLGLIMIRVLPIGLDKKKDAEI